MGPDRVGVRNRGPGNSRADASTCGTPSSNIYRGARIRTGDLCDPNAALYRTEPRPVNPPASHPPRVLPPERTGWDSNPRGCLAPHDFQSCALSHSATHPETPIYGRHGTMQKTTRLDPDQVGADVRQFDLNQPQRREWDSNPRGP
jgi:hypothetical protein